MIDAKEKYRRLQAQNVNDPGSFVKTLEAIEELTISGQRPPNWRELAEARGFSIAGIQYQVGKLKAAGLLIVLPGARGFIVVKEDPQGATA